MALAAAAKPRTARRLAAAQVGAALALAPEQPEVLASRALQSLCAGQAREALTDIGEVLGADWATLQKEAEQQRERQRASHCAANARSVAQSERGAPPAAARR